jgi:hypothetical protein
VFLFLVRVEKAGDLIYWTYYMMDWEKVKQEPSDVNCAICGKPMNRTEPTVDSKGQKYYGYVCHSDKQIVWVKAP